jgi:hypothetical protein
MRTRTYIAIVFLALAPLSAGAGTVMFKYVNESGDRVYSYTLPPGQAEHGSQKIDLDTGQVIESVAPQLPPEKLAEKLRQERALAACREELRRLNALYGSEADIERAEQQTLASLETRIGQLQTNRAQAVRELERLRSQAADAERAGAQIPQTLMVKIERSQSQLDTLAQEIDQRRAEQDQARERYRRELERYRDGTCPAPEPAVAGSSG